MTWTEKIKFLFSSLFAFLLPTIQAAMTAVGQVATASAQAAVVRAEETYGPGHGQEKFKMAYSMVKTDVENAGWTIGVNVGIDLINRTLELAVANLNANTNTNSASK
jgi:hypothetical protein